MTTKRNTSSPIYRGAATVLTGGGLLAASLLGTALPLQARPAPLTVPAVAAHVAAAPKPAPREQAAEKPHTGQRWLHGSTGDDFLSGDDDSELLVGYAGNDVLRGLGGDDHLKALEGDDTLLGGSGDDELDGDDGDDHLAAGSGDDTLAGGSGDDLLEGGSGDDRYVFEAGFGHDRVVERSHDGGQDSLVFTALRKADAEVLRDGADLVIRDATGDDRVTVEGFFSAENSRIERIVYADAETDVTAALHSERGVLLALN